MFVNIVKPQSFVCGFNINLEYENLGSTAYTYYELTEAEINDPNFIDLLENNKYHIIKKETQSGVLYEVTLYKN
ncbi:MAG TPA: hypothetical protein VFF15_06715 [Flavobacteriaceae bacterium]|nr:hypothetical protein [Flavobacteriaceae bacterium]